MITGSLQERLKNFHNIRERARIVENVTLLDVALITDGVVILFAIWSGPSISNFAQTIGFLDQMPYRGEIVIVDIDKMDSSLQRQMLGDVSHGWGEIFMIKNGKVVERFLGANCFEKVKVYINSMEYL